MSTAAEKIQKFFGLSDSDALEESYSDNAYVEKPKNSYSSQSRSYFQDEGKAENTYSNNTMKTSQKQPRVEKVEQQQEVIPKVEKTAPLENVRMPKKVVQMSKKESMLQRDVAGEDKVKKISILEPRTYTESKNIAKCIFRNEIVIINFHLVEETQARRIVDFLTGTVYALDGDIQRLGNEIFICTPPNTEIDSETAKSLLSTQFKEY